MKLRARFAELVPHSAAAHLEHAQALGDAHDDHYVHWEPGSIEDQIVDILDRALALPCNPDQRRIAWAEKLRRLQRIAHGRQATRRAGLDVDDAPAIARFRSEAEAAANLFADDEYFADKLADAKSPDERRLVALFAEERQAMPQAAQRLHHLIAMLSSGWARARCAAYRRRRSARSA